MLWRRRLIGAILLLGPATVLLQGSSWRMVTPLAQRQPSKPPLLVSGAASLSEVLRAIGPGFARTQQVPDPQLNLASSGTLQRQIEQGAPVDVFISAGARQMDALERAGLLFPGTRRNLIGNKVVLVVPAGSSGRLSFAGLASPRIRRIAIGDSTVPAGDYARQVLDHFKLTAAVQSKLVPLSSVRAVAAAVASGNADAGLVYRSDATSVSNLRITATAPPASHSPILYSGAVIRRSRQPGLARAYLATLAAPPAQSVLIRAGFTPLPAGR